MQYESAIGALADLIAEHSETVESIRDLRTKVDAMVDDHADPHETANEIIVLIDEVLR
jgi:hypothetical protein